jgi:tetratricopeptide (TPR) repeat protein
MFIDSLGSEAEARFNAGDYDKALECSTQALQMSEKIGNLWGQAYNRMLIGFVQVDRGEIGQAIQLCNEAILLGDQGSLLASTIGTRSDLAWIYGRYGAIGKGFTLIEEALVATEAKQPDWKDLPLAIKVRLHLLNGNVQSAEKIVGPLPLRPIPIPYSRYTILICLANAELALAQNDPVRALALVEDLLVQVAPLTRVDIPEVMCRRADILIELERLEEAHQILTEARLAAERLGSKHDLLQILSSLTRVNSKLGNQKEAEGNRGAARAIIQHVAESLHEIGLGESFLNQPHIRALM